MQQVQIKFKLKASWTNMWIKIPKITCLQIEYQQNINKLMIILSKSISSKMSKK